MLPVYVLGCSAGEGETDDLDNTNKSFQEGAFATLYTLTKNRQLDASIRLAALKIVLEFLQVNMQRGIMQVTCMLLQALQATGTNKS
jgi:hypothetical protein